MDIFLIQCWRLGTLRKHLLLSPKAEGWRWDLQGIGGSQPAQRTLVENGEDIIASPRHPTVPIILCSVLKSREVSSLASFTKTSTVDNFKYGLGLNRSRHHLKENLQLPGSCMHR